MSSLTFTKSELAAALTRGVRQCVVIGCSSLRDCFKGDSPEGLRLFTVDEEQNAEAEGTFVQTQFESEGLSTALQNAGFDQREPSVFVWLGSAGYRTAEAAVAALAFIASLPHGSGVIFDYVERSYKESLPHGALDALASRMVLASGKVKHLIQPQAVGAMLRGLGFKQVVDLLREDLPVSGEHLVSASV